MNQSVQIAILVC